MIYQILLDTNAKVREVEDQEKSRFIRSIIDCLNINIDFDPEQAQSMDDKISLRSQLKKFDITIIEDLDGGMQIFAKRDKIGEWRKPKYKLKENIAERDPRKKLYMEMQVELWSSFE
jgi:hypothetical protein